jgi:hypothetical protein
LRPGIAALLLALHCPCPRLAAQPDDRGKATAELLKTLRAATASDPALAGALVTGVRGSKDSIRLEGIVQSPEQYDALAKAAAKALAGLPGGEKLFPKGLALTGLPSLKGGTKDGVKVEPLRSVLQKALAEANQDVARQTRIDDLAVNAKTGALVVSGVCISPSAPPDPGPGKTPAHQAAVGEALKAALDKTNAGPVQLELGKVVLIGRDNNPIVKLQRHMVDGKPPRDDFFAVGRYDADGRLVVECFAGKPEYLDEVTKFLSGLKPDDPALPPGKDRFSVRRAGGEGKWPIDVGALQASLAAGPEPLRQTRLDRAYPVYGDKGLEMRFAGVNCHPEIGAEKDKVNRITEQLWQLSRKGWEDLKTGLTPSVVGAIDYVPQPGALLQPEIAAQPAFDGTLVLDGTRENQRASFNAKGELVLPGLRLAEPAEARKLTAFADRLLREKGSRLSARGLTVERMAPSPVPDLLRTELREWVADNEKIEDTWLERLSFDKDGRLRLAGKFADRPDVNLKADLEGRIKAAVKPRVESALKEVTFTLPDDAVVLLEQRPSLAEHVRTLMPKDAKWDGVLLERGYYAPDGTYVLQGLLEDESQKPGLAALMRELTGAEQAKWPLFSGGPWTLDRMTVLKLSPMFVRLQRVTPAYPELDGVQVRRAYHDEKKRLILEARVVGPKPGRAAEDRLKELLAGEPNYVRRAAAGVRLVPAEVIPRNALLARRALANAQMALQDCDMEGTAQALETAILHDPRESLGWFLRAYLNYIRKDMALVDRDLRRTVEAETVGPSALYYPHRRLDRLERVQGQHRIDVRGIEGRVWKEIIEKKPRITLKDV